MGMAVVRERKEGKEEAAVRPYCTAAGRWPAAAAGHALACCRRKKGMCVGKENACGRSRLRLRTRAIVQFFVIISSGGGCVKKKFLDHIRGAHD